MESFTNRNTFLTLAGLFEGGLAAVALVLGWFFEVPLLDTLSWEGNAVLWGLAGVPPLYAGFLLCDRYPAGPLKRIKELLVETLGPIFAGCSKWDLAVVALLAGIGEETLFRGLLMPLFGGETFFESESFLRGLLISSLLFGLAHCVTFSYVILAGLAGLYFGLQWHYSDNLLAPIITHAVYDYLAFVKVAAESRRREAD